MSNVDITALTRTVAITMVRQKQSRSGSRMNAYEEIAKAVGVSKHWLRKFISDSPDAKPSLEAGFNILRLYDRMCDRVEIEIANERAKIAALREDIHAAIPTTARLANGPAQAKEARAVRAEAEKS